MIQALVCAAFSYTLFSGSGLRIYELKWQAVRTCRVTFVDGKRLQTDRQDIKNRYVQVDWDFIRKLAGMLLIRFSV